MYFCEDCNALMRDFCCACCGKKRLREVQDSDFCFLVSLPADKAKYLEENLKLHNIPVASLGLGVDLRTRASGIHNMYIPYAYFERAKELYKLLFQKI